MTRPMFRIALIAFAILFAAAPALASGTAADGEETFARAIAAYDAGRYIEAVRLWRRLADQGDRDAEAALAGLTRQGLGTPRDATRAAALYRRAGLGGHVIAQANFGEMLALGEGIKRDRPRAWAWYQLAARGGNAWAKTQAKGIWKGLTANQHRHAKAALAGLHSEKAARP